MEYNEYRQVMSEEEKAYFKKHGLDWLIYPDTKKDK